MADRDVVNGKGQANCNASPDREEISIPASLAPVNSRHAMILAMARDYFPGLVPNKPRKHRITACESSSGARNKRVRISVESIREDSLDGRGRRSDRPGDVHWQEVSYGDVRKKSSQALPRGRLPKGILKKGNRGKAKSVLKDDPTAQSVPNNDPTAGDFKDIEAPLFDIRDIGPQVPLNDINVRHLDDPESPRPSLAPLGSRMRLSDTSIASVDSKMLDGRYSDISVDARDEDNKSTKVDGIDYLELLRRKMHQAASSEDFVRAGELQQDLRQLEELARDIKAASAKDDCILAGELQSQYRTLTRLFSLRHL